MVGNGSVPRHVAVRVVEDAAVVAAEHHHDHRTSGDDPRQGDRHEVRFGAGVGESHALVAEAIAHEFGEADLGGMNAADAGVGGQCFGNGRVHALLAVAEQTGGVVADEVDVGMTVCVGEGPGVAADERQRERRVVQDRARRSTGEHGTWHVRAGHATRGCGRQCRVACARLLPQKHSLWSSTTV